MSEQTMTDWRGRTYTVEIAYVQFLGGFVAWIDDEPFLEGEPFHSRRAAEQAVRNEMGG